MMDDGFVRAASAQTRPSDSFSIFTTATIFALPSSLTPLERLALRSLLVSSTSLARVVVVVVGGGGALLKSRAPHPP